MELLHKIRKILLKKGVNDLVLTKKSIEDSMVKFANNKVVKTESNYIEFVDIFAEKDKKLITTTMKDFSESSIENTSKKILKFLSYATPNKNYIKIPENKFEYKEIKEGFDKKIMDADEVDLAKSAINSALKNSKRTAGTLQKVFGRKSILTSTGIEQEDKFTSLYLSIRALKSKDASGHKTATSRVLSKFNPEEVGEQAGEIAKLASSPVQGKPGKYDVIFSPLAFAPILGTIGDAASIFSVETGMSFLTKTKDLGNFNIVDDGRLPNGINSSKFDEEGHPTQRTTIIKDGNLKTYLHNTSSAHRYKTKSTGNSAVLPVDPVEKNEAESTGNAGIISPSPTNLIIESKTGNPFNIENGIYITNVWYTRFQNYATGDFSTIPRDGMFIIKNGKIKQPIKNLRVSDNILNLLKNIQSIDNKQEQITSWEAHTPVIMGNILIKDVNLTKPNS